jgi:hypothetical protein
MSYAWNVWATLRLRAAALGPMGKCIEPEILGGGAIAPVKIYNSNSTALVTGLSSNIFGY